MAHVANVCTVGVHADFQMGRCHQTHIPWFQAAEFGVSKLDVWIFFDPQIVRALACPLKQVGWTGLGGVPLVWKWPRDVFSQEECLYCVLNG